MTIVNIIIYKTTRRFIAGFIPVNSVQGPVSRKYRKLFGSKKPFVKIRPAYSVKLVFSYVVEGVKIEIYITAKFRALRPFRVEDTKGIRSPEMRPKSFGTLEERTPNHYYPRTRPLYVYAGLTFILIS